MKFVSVDEYFEDARDFVFTHEFDGTKANMTITYVVIRCSLDGSMDVEVLKGAVGGHEILLRIHASKTNILKCDGYIYAR